MRVTWAILLWMAASLLTLTADCLQVPFSGDSVASEVEGFTLFRHHAFPDHQMRYKRSDGWCDGADTRSWSGYLDFDDSHIFFYYFESRSKPSEDPVILWIAGGPGSSASLALLMELGPCKIVEEGPPTNSTASTRPNPYSWNQHANLLFIDQPVGVGFSYADHGKHVGTSDKAAKDVQAFIALFFETFSDLKGRSFHIAGESYGGRYVPLIASAIADHNKQAIAGGMTAINLKSIMVGNGLADMLTTIPTWYTQACTNISGAPTGPVLDIKTCASMQAYIPTCERWLRGSCLDRYDVRACAGAYEQCTKIFMDPYMNAKWNPYDVTKPCPALYEDACYSASTRITSYLDDPVTRKNLGVPVDRPKFEGFSWKVSDSFDRHMDLTPMIGTYHYYTGLVERGIDVLIYNGKYDWMCNWKSNQIWLDNLVWTGAKSYLSEEMKPWYAKIDGCAVKAGDTKTAYSLGGGRITFATIEKAGHMAPYDQPEVALSMVDRWIKGETL